MEENVYKSYIRRLHRKVVKKVCRFCVRKRIRRTVISAEPSKILLLAKLFTQVTQLPFVINADYPDYICHECEKALQRTADSMLSFKEADVFWRMYFQRGDDRPEEWHSNNENMDTISDSETNNEPAHKSADEPCPNIKLEKDNFIIGSGAENAHSLTPASNQEYPIEEVILGDIQLKIENPEPIDRARNNETNG